MKKRFTILTVGVICAVSIAIGAAATAVVQQITAELRPDFEIVIDGEIKTFKDANGKTVYPVLYEGTTYLPIRAIGEIMGKTVYWYEDDKRIELKSSTVTDADVILPSVSGTTAETPKQNTNHTGSDSAAANSEYIGVDTAKKIALEKAGLSASEVIFEKAELDHDDGRAEYDIEFKQGRTEYSAEISAIDGTIYSWEADTDD